MPWSCSHTFIGLPCPSCPPSLYVPSWQIARYVVDESKVEVLPISGSPSSTLLFRPLVDQPGPIKIM